MNRVRPPENFLRFVVPWTDEDSNRPQGVFRAIGYLRDSGTLTAAEVAHIRETLEWFNVHLKAPAQCKVSKRDTFWYREGATEVIQRMWGLVNILRSHDVFVEILRTDSPGRISYQDEHQVAALGPKRGGAHRR